MCILLRAGSVHPCGEAAPAIAPPLVACTNSDCAATSRGWAEKVRFHRYAQQCDPIKIDLDIVVSSRDCDLVLLLLCRGKRKTYLCVQASDIQLDHTKL